MSAITSVTSTRISPKWWAACAGAVLLALILGISIGAVAIPPNQTALELLSRIPGLGIHSGLSEIDAAIIWDLRLPRVVLALVVGSMLASAGTAYQGTFRNPLADPYLLGVSAGAGLGATVEIVIFQSPARWSLPVAAFLGALIAVSLTYALGRSSIAGRSATSLVLAGVAVAALLTAAQTLVQQRNSDKVREVYAWILGRLAVGGWSDLALVAPYVLVCTVVLLRYRRVLDVFAVGDEEATTLGLPVGRARAVIILAASLGTAAAVAVTGLIGFVGIIVPHTLRLIAGNSYRKLLPLSAIFGGVFLVLADIIARTAMSPQEIPIGVVTALFGAPVFLYILASNKEGALV
ncbi:MAG: iron ABC transporter permease [Actinomycetales bacterium]|nr:iron ABC transporter permease [Actinomycetales bacterium]